MTAEATVPAAIDAAEFGKAIGALIKEATAPLLARISALEARQPERGEKGEPGAKGADAEPIDIKAAVAELLAADEFRILTSLEAADAVAKHFEAHPVKNGIDGARGEPGPKGDSIKGDPGADGVGLAGAIIDRDGNLTITTTKGDPIKLGVVTGRDGAPGKDGIDLSDVEFDYDGVRTISIKARDGRVAKSYKLPIPIDRGYWREGMSAEQGDIVTHGGNAWLALKDTAAKPCTENAQDWRLFARKGRDGVDGRAGRDLGPAPPVKLVTAGND